MKEIISSKIYKKLTLVVFVGVLLMVSCSMSASAGAWGADVVYLDYLDEITSPSKLIATDIKVENQTPSTYYCAFSWTAVGEAVVGYYGIQSDSPGSPYGKHVHFTVWDTPDGKQTTVVNKSEDVQCKHWYTEGNFHVCTWSTDWLEDQYYKLIINVSTNDTSTFYSAYVYDYSKSELKYIATLEYHRKDKWIASIATFIENFGFHPDCSAPYRSFLVGNGYKVLINETKINLCTARYVPIGSPEGFCGERNAEVQGSYFKLETGKGAVEKIPPYSILERACNGSPTTTTTTTSTSTTTTTPLTASEFGFGSLGVSLAILLVAPMLAYLIVRK